MGGGMRQAGFLAAAGSYALDHHVERLRDDHRRARALGQAVEGLSYTEKLLSPETNIVLFRLKTGASHTRLVEHLARQEVRAGGYQAYHSDWVRLVVHLGIDDSGIDRTIEALKSFSFSP